MPGGNIRLSGQTGILLVEFVRYMHGFLDIILISEQKYYEIIGNYDVGANLVPKTNFPSTNPLITSTKSCIVLPYERLLPMQRYYSTANVDDPLFVLGLFYSLVLALMQRLFNPLMPWPTIIFKAFKTFIGMSIDGRTFSRMHLSEKVLLISIQLYTVILIGIIESSLTTAFTTGLRSPDIVNANGFLASDLRIMIHNPNIVKIFERNQLPIALIDRLILVDEQTHNHHLYSLNESFAYVVDEDRWPLIEYIQGRLDKPKLKLVPEALCGNHRFLRLPIRLELGFTNHLALFVRKIQSAGLLEFWMRLGLYEAKKAGLLHQVPHQPCTMHPLPFQFFEYYFIVAGLGLFISLLTCLLEIALMYRRTRRDKLNNVIIV